MLNLNMESFYLILLILYLTVPTLSLFYITTLIYRDHNQYAKDILYLFKYLITLSFLPAMFLPNINLSLIPTDTTSVFLIIMTFILILLGIRPAMKKKILFFYISGTFAAFMEEILYRGVIMGLSTALWHNLWISLVISSIGFGSWHLKNYYWLGKRNTIIQFLYTTFIYGPLFGLMTILTGDIYLSVFAHYVTNATVSLAPDWMRGWLVFGGKKDR